jgi:hypothetical protein
MKHVITIMKFRSRNPLAVYNALGAVAKSFRLIRQVAFTEQLATSRLLFPAEFLEGGIGTQRVPMRIEPKKGRCNRRSAVSVSPTEMWCLQQPPES